MYEGEGEFQLSSSDELRRESSYQNLGTCFDNIHTLDMLDIGEFLEKDDNNIIIQIYGTTFCANRGELKRWFENPEHHFVDRDDNEYYSLYERQIVDLAGARDLMDSNYRFYNVYSENLKVDIADDNQYLMNNYQPRNIHNIYAYTIEEWINA
jgi:hypothetical protein